MSDVVRIDSSISFQLSKLSNAKFSILYDISLVRDWKRKLWPITPGSELRIHDCVTKVCHVVSDMRFVLQVRAKFSVDDYSHYLFTPRDLTNWILGLLRYNLDSGSGDRSAQHLLEIWAYEGKRLFRDRLVGKQGLDKFDRWKALYSVTNSVCK